MGGFWVGRRTCKLSYPHTCTQVSKKVIWSQFSRLSTFLKVIWRMWEVIKADSTQVSQRYPTPRQTNASYRMIQTKAKTGVLIDVRTWVVQAAPEKVSRTPAAIPGSALQQGRQVGRLGGRCLSGGFWRQRRCQGSNRRKLAQYAGTTISGSYRASPGPELKGRGHGQRHRRGRRHRHLPHPQDCSGAAQAQVSARAT